MKALLGLVLILAPAPPDGEGWPQFRGPTGDGRSPSVGLPLEWSESKNVTWKTGIPGLGWSSPVVSGNQVWLTTASPNGGELSAVCVDRTCGKIVYHRKIFDIERPEDIRDYNSHASPTPAIEEGRVYVHFGSLGTACLETETGSVVWSRRDLPCKHVRGPGSSPILYGDLLFINFDGYDVQYVVALDKKTGRTLWKRDRTHPYGTDDGDTKKAFSTPTIIEVNGSPQLISPAAKAAIAYDPRTGNELWRVRYPEHSTAARPFLAHGLVYINTGFVRAQLLAVRPDGEGDVTDSHVLWKVGKGVGSKPSAIVEGDLLFAVTDTGGAVTCLEATTGKEVWKGRIGGLAHSASPISALGVVYFFAEDGTAVALRAGRELKVIARNSLEGRFMASPAVVGNSLFLRSETHLYRLDGR